MRYLRTSGPSMFEALRHIAAAVDACWWYLGGSGFQRYKGFDERLRAGACSEEELQEFFMLMLGELVDFDAAVGRVGRPGFFQQLGDTVGFHWACHFAIEGDQMPLPALRAVSTVDRLWFGPFEALPPEVVLVARDIDSAYQDYGFRDEWMFQATLHHLRNSGYRADEVTRWPQA